MNLNKFDDIFEGFDIFVRISNQFTNNYLKLDYLNPVVFDSLCLESYGPYLGRTTQQRRLILLCSLYLKIFGRIS